VAVDPDGRLIVSGGEDGVVRTWDLETGRPIRSIPGHSGPALSIAVSPDGQLLYSGGSDGKVKVWNSQTGEVLQILWGHPEGVGSVAPSSDGRYLATGGYNGTVKIWEREGAKMLRTPSPEEERADPGPSRLGSLVNRLPWTSGRPQDLPD
jgi:WD40 repeat protein